MYNFVLEINLQYQLEKYWICDIVCYLKGESSYQIFSSNLTCFSFQFIKDHAAYVLIQVKVR